MEHVNSPDSLRVAAIRYYMDKLNAWHAALPLTMRLATLSSEDSDMLPPNQRFALLLVHLLYLGAVTLLHRPILAAVANLSRNGTWEVDASPEQVRGFENDCITAASQGARVVALLKADGTFPKQCWIVVHQGFDSCCILLFSAAQKLFHRKYDGLHDTIIQIEDCIDLLVWCSSSSSAAGHFVDLLRPLYERLRELFAVLTNTGPTRVDDGSSYLHRNVKAEPLDLADLNYSHAPASSPELLDFVEGTTQLLLDPRGATQAFHRP
ncbi:hypothetical protein H2199_000907 [Coniosporium tulheliwenetii]|nr:hypothetical protein H2199_000907 [Cladosporium sp. JES 115]